VQRILGRSVQENNQRLGGFEVFGFVVKIATIFCLEIWHLDPAVRFAQKPPQIWRVNSKTFWGIAASALAR
jgi:hypothetical protein